MLKKTSDNGIVDGAKKFHDNDNRAIKFYQEVSNHELLGRQEVGYQELQ